MFFVFRIIRRYVKLQCRKTPNLRSFTFIVIVFDITLEEEIYCFYHLRVLCAEAVKYLPKVFLDVKSLFFCN